MNCKITVEITQNNVTIIKKNFERLPVLFGRSPQCHLAAPELSLLSRTHGSINYERGHIVITDLNSTNGLYVGDERLVAIREPVDPKNGTAKVIFSLPVNEKVKAPRIIFKVEITELIDDVTITMEKSQKKFVPLAPVANLAPAPAQAPVPRQGKQSSPHSGEEMDLTVVSRRLHHAWKNVSLESEQNLRSLKKEDISLQGVLTWGDEILDVRQFNHGDELSVGQSIYDPIYLPSIGRKTKFGIYGSERGIFYIPDSIRWRLSHKGHDFSTEEALSEQLVEKRNNGYKFSLDLEDTCSIDLGGDISLHMRYVEIPRPLVARTWIENREEFKKAITFSIIVHLVFCMIALRSASPVQAPVVDNLPPRFAKLLVEPPPQVLAPKIPEPPPPKPEPIQPQPPIVAQPPTPVKSVTKRPPNPIKPMVQQKPTPVRPNARTTSPTPTRARPIGPTTNPAQDAAAQAAKKSQDMANSFANAFGSAPGPAAGKPSNIRIDNSSGSSVGGIKTAGLVGSIKSKVAQGSGAGGGIGGGTNLAQASGQSGYAKGNGNAGKRGVGGGVVGTPRFENPSSPQGLNNNEIMKVVNRHLSDIQRCYERALFQNSNLAGRVEYEWNITPTGQVSATSVKRSEIGNGEFLNSCVLAIFKKMKFPASTNRQSTVANIGFPFGKN